jgi:hypothetical protein
VASNTLVRPVAVWNDGSPCSDRYDGIFDINDRTQREILTTMRRCGCKLAPVAANRLHNNNDDTAAQPQALGAVAPAVFNKTLIVEDISSEKY